MRNPTKPSLDIVVPVYNEARGLAAFQQELSEVADRLPFGVEIYYVDDGSTDGTDDVLESLASKDPRVVVIELSRNFGHQAALTAGLDASRGDVVITMDGDGQHPPALIPEMLHLFSAGYEVVLAQREYAKNASMIKRSTSRAFYWLLSRIGDTRIAPGCADYRLMSRSVVDALQGMQEYHRFLRGMVAWLGYRTVIVPYLERNRGQGKSKHGFRRMLRLAGDAVSSFSLVPLRLGIAVGAGFLVIALLEVGYVVAVWLWGDRSVLVPGWSSLMFAILSVGGVFMILLGLVGSYVGYIFQEVKRRPVYVVRAFHHGDRTSPGRDSP